MKGARRRGAGGSRGIRIVHFLQLQPGTLAADDDDLDGRGRTSALPCRAALAARAGRWGVAMGWRTASMLAFAAVAALLCGAQAE